MTSFSIRLEDALSSRKMLPSELSKRTGIGEGAISQYRKGAYKASQRNLEKIASALGVSIPWLMGIEEELPTPSNITPIPKFVRKPRLGTIACGKPTLAVEEAGEYDFVPDDVACDFTLKCQGDSMINARIFDGDTVYIRSQPTVENGEIAAVVIDTEATLKMVYYYPADARLVLRACNPTYADIVYTGDGLNQVKIIGKAVAFTSMIRIH